MSASSSFSIRRRTSKEILDAEKFESLAKNYKLVAKEDKNEVRVRVCVSVYV